MVNWYLGTMGFSYSDWVGTFYPAGTASRDYLSLYSRTFNAVELDSTFYAIPRSDQVRRWGAITPAGFQFTAKVPQQITHEMRLAGAMDMMKIFVDTMQLLEDKLAMLLLQFPPDFTADEMPTLETFLQELPASMPYSVEFRHRSWYTTTTQELLKAHHVCWASTDYLNLPKSVELTTDFLYMRWIGRHGQFQNHDREIQDMTKPLETWVKRLQPVLPKVKTVYGFFNNDYAGHSPTTCNRFKALIGITPSEVPAGVQGTLF
jgi:uncharacterized protein YecE (DUF72 family)